MAWLVPPMRGVVGFSATTQDFRPGLCYAPSLSFLATVLGAAQGRRPAGAEVLHPAVRSVWWLRLIGARV